MADVSDAADGLVSILAAAAYPSGTDQPSIGACDIIVYQGWPDSQSLEADLADGKVHVSVFPRPGDTVTSIVTGDADWDERDNNGTTGSAIREVRRQTRQMQIIVWAPTPDLRSKIGGALDAVLAVTSRIVLSDGTTAVITYVNSAQSDEQQKLMIYRRDLFYAANYATIQTEAEYVVLHPSANVSAGPSDVIQVSRANLTP